MNFLNFSFLSTNLTGPTDLMTVKASNAISTVTGIRNLLSEGIFISNDPSDRVRLLNDIFPLALAADKAGMK
jgi:hypothetical protein